MNEFIHTLLFQIYEIYLYYIPGTGKIVDGQRFLLVSSRKVEQTPLSINGVFNILSYCSSSPILV